MDLSLGTLLDSLEAKKEAVKASMRATTEAYKETVAKQQAPARLLPSTMEKPYTLRDQLYDADKEIGAPRGTHYGMLVAENRGYKGGEFPTSPKDAVGFAQQTPIFLAEMKRLGVGDYDPNNPVLAISRMTFDLKRNYKHFKDWDKTIAAYNTGRKRMINAKILAASPKETRDYVNIVNTVVKTGKPPVEAGKVSKEFEQYLDTPVLQFLKGK